jgi:hypothetical protein
MGLKRTARAALWESILRRVADDIRAERMDLYYNDGTGSFASSPGHDIEVCRINRETWTEEEEG